jgi:hypothetical protein
MILGIFDAVAVEAVKSALLRITSKDVFLIKTSFENILYIIYLTYGSYWIKEARSLHIRQNRKRLQMEGAMGRCKPHGPRWPGDMESGERSAIGAVTGP